MSETDDNVEPAESETATPTEVQHGAGSIVVGVDGSAGSLEALHWAVQEARLRGVPVHAVMAWQQSLPYYGGDKGWALGEDPSIGSKTDLAAASAVEVARLRDEARIGSDVDITYETVEGHPADVLVRASKGALAVVVGSRGHGGFIGALIGSVSQHVVQHATCPVVVVPSVEQAVYATQRDRAEPVGEHHAFLATSGVFPS